MTPHFEVLGFVITEPTTMLTDYAITIVAMVFAWRLAQGDGATAGRRAWCAAFLFIAIGALLGGTSHGFANYTSAAAAGMIWKATLFTVGLSMFCAVAGTVQAVIGNRVLRRVIHATNLIALLSYSTWALHNDDYVGVIVVTVGSLGFIALLEAWRWLSQKAPSAAWIVSGVLVSFASAGIQQSGYSLHEHFNHNDLYHVIQIAGLYLLYRGVLLLPDSPTRSAVRRSDSAGMP